MLAVRVPWNGSTAVTAPQQQLKKIAMKAKAAAHVLCCIACLLITNSKAFAPRPLNFAGEVGDCVQLTRHHHNQDHHHPYSSTSRYKRVHGSLASWPRNSVHEPSTAERDRVGALGSTVRRVRTGRSSRRKSILASAYSEGEPSPGSNETKRPSGPGAGLIDLHFRHIKSGGFKVFLLFFLLGVRRFISAHFGRAQASPCSSMTLYYFNDTSRTTII